MNSPHIPIHILTGFLGSGKTTLLNRLLTSPFHSGTLVIINEFGETSIDHHLVEKSTETIFELSNGCICCTMRGELVETLLSLDLDHINRVIIETTGIADPIPLLQNLSDQELQARGLYAAGTLAVFDMIRGKQLLEAHPEVERQLALADMVYLSRIDTNPVHAEVERIIYRVNPLATCVSNPEEVNLNNLSARCTLASKANRVELPKISKHESRYSSLLLTHAKPQPLSIFSDFLHHLSALLGPTLMRVKGFAYCRESELPVLLQMSGHILHDPVPMREWPNDRVETRLVVIGTDMDLEKVRSAFNSFFEITLIDTPDREALTNNPLSISGY